MKHLKIWLKESGRTQSDLARALGRDKSAVTLLLQGKRQLKVSEIPVIAAFFDVPEAAVVSGQMTQPEDPVEPAVSSSSEAPPLSSIPIVGHLSSRLRESPHVTALKEGGYGYLGAPPPPKGSYLFEVPDMSLQLSGLVPGDLVLCVPNIALNKNDIVLVTTTDAQGELCAVLRKYQPPFLVPNSAQDGFERLHEERASVKIIATIVELIRHYR